MIQAHRSWRESVYALTSAFVLVTCWCVLPASCTMYSTTTGGAGLPYFLPKGLIHIVITETKRAATAKSETSTSTQDAGSASTTTDGSTEDSTQQVSASAAKVEPVSITRVIKVEAIIVADKDHGAKSVRYVPNALQDDVADLKVNPNTSLLQTTTSTSTDQTAAIISDVVQTGVNIVRATQAFGAVASSTRRVAPSPGATPVPYRPLDLDITFEPENWASEYRRIEANLQQSGIDIKVRPTLSPPEEASKGGVGVLSRHPRLIAFLVTDSGFVNCADMKSLYNKATFQPSTRGSRRRTSFR